MDTTLVQGSVLNLEPRVEQSMQLWGKFHLKNHLISPRCSWLNSVFIVQKRSLKDRHVIPFHFYTQNVFVSNA